LAEQTPVTLNHFVLVQMTDAFWQAAPADRRAALTDWLRVLRGGAERVDFLQVFPTGHRADLLVWCAVRGEDPQASVAFFEHYARSFMGLRVLARPVDTLWGYTQPSPYTKARSNQEIDPFAEQRKQFLVVYPFVKTTEWYRLERDARQGMMNAHIRVGKQFEEITQLLLYSFGVQDQEFVVVYETDDLRRFSRLVADLRRTDARVFTERDAPLHTAVYRPAERTIELFC
jgi:chlorite dismutase